MRPDDAIRIRHMIGAAESAVRFVAGRHRGDLDKDEMLLFAVVRAIEILGEAAAKVSQETRSAASSVPWFAAISMRNRLIHAYHDVDHDIVWNTVTEEIPALLDKLRPLVSEP